MTFYQLQFPATQLYDNWDHNEPTAGWFRLLSRVLLEEFIQSTEGHQKSLGAQVGTRLGSEKEMGFWKETPTASSRKINLGCQTPPMFIP